MERSSGGLERGSSHGTGRGIDSVCTVNAQQDRQEEVWSVPPNTERREDDMERRESSRVPPTSLPVETRSFTDWSSLDSPRVRTSPQIVSIQDTGHDIDQPDNQMVQPGLEPEHVGVMENIINDGEITFSAHQQPNQVGARLMDVGTNTSDVEVRSQRVGTSVINSSNDVELSSGSHVRIRTTRRTEMIPQLDGPISMYSRERILEDVRTEQELN